MYILLKSHAIFLQPCELTVHKGNSVGNYAELLMGYMMDNWNLVPEWDANSSPCFCVLTELSPVLFCTEKILSKLAANH